MPRYEVFIPKGKDAAFQRFVAGAGGTVYSQDTTVGLDYMNEAESVYVPFVARLQDLLIPNPDPYIEDRRISGFNSVIPELSGKEIFQRGEIEDLPDELQKEFREALVGRFISGLNPHPTKVSDGKVEQAVGTPVVELIMMQYGLEDGVPHTAADVARMKGLSDPARVRASIRGYFDTLSQETRLPRKQSTPLREAMFKIRRRLEMHRVK